MRPLSSKATKNFQEVQYHFTRYLRDPENIPPPADIDESRASVYRYKVHHGIGELISSCFPVIKQITSDEDWDKMVRDFISNYYAHSPLFPEFALEFLKYLEREQHRYPDFLLELATYERVEVSVARDCREIDLNNIDTKGDLLKGVPVLNPIIMPQTYRYAVHKINGDYIPETPAETPFYLLFYRRRDDNVRFLELNPGSARLIECMQSNDNKTGMRLLQTIAEELQHPDPQVVIDGGYEIMREMHDKDVILGVKAD